MASTPVEIPPFAPGFDPDDPFRYGWRYVTRTLDDGNLRLERVPLTLEDVLHPQEGDSIAQNETHYRWCTYLNNVFRLLLARVTGAVVLGDCRILWAVDPPLWHSPDIAVIFNVRERKPWSTFRVAEEGATPALVVEVTSPETADLDRTRKLDEYAEVGVPLYVIIDRHRHRGQDRVRLFGYTLADDGYQALAPDERGRLWLAPVGCWLGVEDGEPACYDAQGQPIRDTPELALALEEALAARREAEAQAREEAAARREAEGRLRELEAELRRLRGE